MKARLSHFLSETPILFIGAVLAIAITFRVGIGAIKTASAEPEAPVAAAPAVHTPVTTPTPAKVAAATPAVATPTPAKAETVAPAMPEPARPLPKRKAPRTHGKR